MKCGLRNADCGMIGGEQSLGARRWVVSDIQPFRIAGSIAPHLAIPKAPLPNRFISSFGQRLET
jgi:hypothetical protein